MRGHSAVSLVAIRREKQRPGMERFYFKKRPSADHKKQTPLKAPPRSFSEAREELLRSLRAKQPIVLRTDLRHCSTVGKDGPEQGAIGRYRASSISSLDQYRNSRNLPRYRPRSVTKSLSEDAFGECCPPVVITETELSSSWLYKSMKAVANGVEETEQPIRSRKTLKSEPSLSPVPLKDPRMKPIPVPTRSPKPRSACSRCCYLGVLMILSVCCLGFLSTIGAIVYIEMFTNSTISWDAGALAIVSKNDGFEIYDDRFDTKVVVNEESAPYGNEQVARNLQNLEVTAEEKESESHRMQVLSPGAKGSQSQRLEVQASEEKVQQKHRQETAASQPIESQGQQESSEIDSQDHQEGKTPDSVDSQNYQHEFRTPEAGGSRDQHFQASEEELSHQQEEQASEAEVQQDDQLELDQEVKGPPDNEVAKALEGSDGKGGFGRRTIHLVDYEHPLPADLTQFIDNVRTQIRLHKDRSIIHEESPASPDEHQEIDDGVVMTSEEGNTSKSMEVSKNIVEHKENDGGLDDLSSNISHDVVPSDESQSMQRDEPSSDIQEGSEEKSLEINKSDDSDVLETQYQDLFEDGVKDADDELQDEDVNTDTEESSDQHTEAAFMLERNAEQLPSEMLRNGEAPNDVKTSEVQDAPLSESKQDLEEDSSDKNVISDTSERTEKESETEVGNQFESSSDLNISDVNETDGDSHDLSTESVGTNLPPQDNKVNQFFSRSGELPVPEIFDNAHNTNQRSQGVRNRRPPLKNKVNQFSSISDINFRQNAEPSSESHDRRTQVVRKGQPPLEDKTNLFFANMINHPFPQNSDTVFSFQDSRTQAGRNPKRPPLGETANLFQGKSNVPSSPNSKSVSGFEDPRTQVVRSRRPPLPGRNRQQFSPPGQLAGDNPNSLAEAVKQLSVLDTMNKAAQSRTKSSRPRSGPSQASAKVSRQQQVQNIEREIYMQHLKRQMLFNNMQ